MDTENRQTWLQPREGRTLKTIEFTPPKLKALTQSEGEGQAENKPP